MKSVHSVLVLVLWNLSSTRIYRLHSLTILNKKLIVLTAKALEL